MVAVRVEVDGRVQGVGFRYYALRCAAAVRVSGWVANRDDGVVEAFVQGPRDDVDAFLDRLRLGPQAARVDSFRLRPAAYDPLFHEFLVLPGPARR